MFSLFILIATTVLVISLVVHVVKGLTESDPFTGTHGK